MQPKITKLLFLLIALISLPAARAQQWLGRTTGNYSGTYGVYNNASSISDSKYRFYFNFWGRGINFYNNYLTYNAPIKLNHWANNNYSWNYKKFDGTVDYQKDWLLEDLNGKNKQFSFNQDIFGPSFMFPISKQWNMSINTRQRSGMQMFGISESAATLAFNKIDSGSRASINKGFGINAQSFQELSFTLGGVLAKNERNEFNGGLTFKFIRGLGAAYLKGNSLDINATGTNSALVSGDMQFAYTDDKSLIEPFNQPYGLFALNSRGIGAGIDIGLSYTHKSRKTKYTTSKYCDNNDKRSDHDFKLALALNDVGGIRFNRMSSKYTYSSNIYTTAAASNNILDPFHYSNVNAFDSIGENIFKTMGATKSTGFSTALPTAINMQMDFRLTKNFYTSVFWNQSLKGYNSTGLRSTSMLSVIPRIESRGFEFSMPITLSENYRNFYVGAYTRIGPVFFGSDNLGGLLNVASASQFRGADIYGGISFGLGYCHSSWYESNVDPVYMDSTKNDSLRTELKDTVKIIQRDTIIIKDTVTVEKVINNKTLIEKETELKKREEELNKRKVLLDAREKEITKKQNGTFNESEELKKCKDQGIILVNENTTLKDKAKTQTDATIAANKKIADLEKELAICKTGNGTKTNADVVKLQKKADSLSVILAYTRTEFETCKKNSNTTNAEVVKMGKKVDSLNILLAFTRTEYENCKKNSTMSSAEIVKKAENDRRKAENDARLANKRADSLAIVLASRTSDLDFCKKNSSMNSAELVKKAENDRAKAENDARIARKQADSLKIVLAKRDADLENCKKNTIQTDADVVKKLEADKAKAENDARIAKKQTDSLTLLLVQKTTEYENCKKNSTMSNAEVVKKLEGEKAKAENDAKVAKKQSDSLVLILVQKTADLDNCKKNSTQNNADIEKMKKCEDNNALLKAEMSEMTKTISRLNGKNYTLSNQVDSLVNELKNCCKNCNTGNNTDAEALKKCQSNNAELNAEISKLKSVINAKDNSLDSMKAVVTDMNKKQVELNATISKLNTDISDLKNKSSDCSDLQKQLDAKNAEITKLKSDNSTLQNQINTITAQLNEYKTEYQFMVKQNNKCSMKLDSCMRGLYNNETHGGSGGPMMPDMNQGSNDSNEDEELSSTDVNAVETEETESTEITTKKTGQGLNIGARIIGAILEEAINNNHSESGNNSNRGSSTSSSDNNERSRNSGSTVSTSTNNRSGNVFSSGNSGGSSTAGNAGTSSTTVSKPNADPKAAGNNNSSSASGVGLGGNGSNTGATVNRR